MAEKKNLKGLIRAVWFAWVAWAESPSGKHALIAIAAALGTAAEQAIKAWVGH